MADEITLDFIGRSPIQAHDEMRAMRTETSFFRNEQQAMRTETNIFRGELHGVSGELRAFKLEMRDFRAELRQTGDTLRRLPERIAELEAAR